MNHVTEGVQVCTDIPHPASSGTTECDSGMGEGGEFEYIRSEDKRAYAAGPLAYPEGERMGARRRELTVLNTDAFIHLSPDCFPPLQRRSAEGT